jgi:phage terminase large subunit
MRGGFEIFHYDDGSGMDAEEWITRLRAQPAADKLILPHDARAKTFQSSRTVVETFLADTPWVGCEVRVNAQRKKADSINAGRLMPARRIRISSSDACEPFLMAMRAYAFKYDTETKTFSSEPEHNWASHGADAFMEGAAVLHELEPEAPKTRVIIPSINRTWTLDDLHETCGVTPHGRL